MRLLDALVNSGEGFLDLRAPLRVIRRPGDDGGVFDGQCGCIPAPLRKCHTAFDVVHRCKQAIKVGTQQARKPSQLCGEEPLFSGKQQIPTLKLLVDRRAKCPRQSGDQFLCGWCGHAQSAWCCHASGFFDESTPLRRACRTGGQRSRAGSGPARRSLKF